MTHPTAATELVAACDHDTTMALALELSGKSWELGAVVPGLTRRPRRRLEPRDLPGQIERWKAEAATKGRRIGRVVLTYEAGRDGFWIARALVATIRRQKKSEFPVGPEESGRQTSFGKRKPSPTGCGMLSQGVLGFQYEAEPSGGGLTALAGLPLYLELVQASGLPAAIRRHVHVAGGRAGWTCR